MPPNEKLSLLPASADVDNAFHKKAALSSLTPTAWTEAKLLWTEAKLLGELAFTTVIIQLGFTLPPFLIASHVGRHYGTVYLDGFTLAILTGNLFTLSVLQGLYSAADTLSPQAFGAGNPRQVGLLAMRGFFGSMMLIIPITIVLLIWMKPILVAAGENETASTLAWHWYQIYSLTLPFYALYMVTWKFLSAQNVMMPLVVVVAFSCVVVLPITLQVFPALFGFLGTAWAIFTFQAIEAVGLIGILWWFQPHDPETWPGISAWREALEWKPFCTYMTLGVGGMLASSEWMYWEALALFIGTLGVVPLSVHTIPTQVIMVMFMVPLGIGIALSVRLGTTLPQSVKRAKQLVAGTFVVGLTMLGIMAVFLYVYRYWIFRIFSEDPEVLELAEQIWWRVVLYFINLSIFGINMGVAIGLGMQWTLGFVTVLFLWLLGMPAAYYFAIYRGGGLVVAWSWIVPPYAAINVALMFAYLTKDWDEIAAAIRLREGIERGDSDIEGLTLNETHETGSNGYGSASTAAVVQ